MHLRGGRWWSWGDVQRPADGLIVGPFTILGALAMAYARKNNLADADLASAQAAFARGDNKTARELADRAKQRFPIGSPGWVRADDIVAFNKNHKQNPLRPDQ